MAAEIAEVYTADSCEWSADGTLLGLVDANSGGVQVFFGSEPDIGHCRWVGFDP